VPVEEAWRIHNESQKGLSDGSRSRFAMAAEAGKAEVVAVTDSCPDLSGKEQADGAAAATGVFDEGLVIMKMHRSPAEAGAQGDLIVARRNPKALWLSDYEDRIIYDGRRRGAAKCTGLIEGLKHSLLA
jgi:hypothetical protein